MIIVQAIGSAIKDSSEKLKKHELEIRELEEKLSEAKEKGEKLLALAPNAQGLPAGDLKSLCRSVCEIDPEKHPPVRQRFSAKGRIRLRCGGSGGFV